MPDLRIQAVILALLALFAVLWYGARHLKRQRHGPAALQSLFDEHAKLIGALLLVLCIGSAVLVAGGAILVALGQ